MKGKQLGILIAALALGGGAWFLFGGSDEPGPDAGQTRPGVARRGLLRIVVPATGEVKPLRQIELKSKASGEVVRFGAREGDVVQAEQMIAELDKSTEQRNVQRAEADRDTAQAQLKLARLEHTRALKNARAAAESAKADVELKQREHERLAGLAGAVSSTEVENARLTLVMAEQALKQAETELSHVLDRKEADELLARARLKQAEVALEDARDRLNDTDIRSPIDGILLQKLIEEGQIVASGISASTGGTPIAIVADTSVMLVEANVDESDIGKVRLGQPVELTVDAHPGRTFHGKVDLIPPLGVLESNIRVYRVQIQVVGEGVDLLKSGMTANVEVVIDREEDVIMVPTEAIKRDDEGVFVWLKDGDSKKRTPVKIGRDTGLEAEVLEGLQDGAEIVIVYEAEELGRNRWRRRRR